MDSVARHIRVARASRVLATASSLSRTFLRGDRFGTEDRFGETPKPARETRALPGFCCQAFTLIELLVVMAIIIILAGLVVATTGYVQEKGKRSRAEAEIAAISAALENYKADNGIYPTGIDTETFDPKTDGNSEPSQINTYTKASLELYSALTDTTAGSRTPGAHSYFTFKPQMLYPLTPPDDPVKCIRDPFGNSYGYSTLKAEDPTATGGYNPTFDLWSTGGEITTATNPNQAKWIKNW